VKKRRPIPPSGGPASSVKIVTGISTLVPVLGISNFRHAVLAAKASVGTRLKTKAVNKRGTAIEQSPVQSETIERINFRSQPDSRGAGAAVEQLIVNEDRRREEGAKAEREKELRAERRRSAERKAKRIAAAQARQLTEPQRSQPGIIAFCGDESRPQGFFGN